VAAREDHRYILSAASHLNLRSMIQLASLFLVPVMYLP
jgi:hypothetical protein